MCCIISFVSLQWAALKNHNIMSPKEWLLSPWRPWNFAPRTDSPGSLKEPQLEAVRKRMNQGLDRLQHLQTSKEHALNVCESLRATKPGNSHSVNESLLSESEFSCTHTTHSQCTHTVHTWSRSTTHIWTGNIQAVMEEWTLTAENFLWMTICSSLRHRGDKAKC